jgi:hypothetical protein
MGIRGRELGPRVPPLNADSEHNLIQLVSHPTRRALPRDKSAEHP